jgi:hypothetical protein
MRGWGARECGVRGWGEEKRCDIETGLGSDIFEFLLALFFGISSTPSFVGAILPFVWRHSHVHNPLPPLRG